MRVFEQIWQKIGFLRAAFSVYTQDRGFWAYTGKIRIKLLCRLGDIDYYFYFRRGNMTALTKSERVKSFKGFQKSNHSQSFQWFVYINTFLYLYHIETSPLICANQWTGFYMISASVMKGLRKVKGIIKS